MNCREWEERLALYAGDDLSAPERAEVERHAGECAGCQVFLSGLNAALETLKGAHADPVAEAHYAAVRARVISDLRRERRRWAWRIAWVAAALVLALAPALWLARRPVPPAPTVAVAHPPAPLVAVGEPRVEPRPVRRMVRHARPRPATPPEPFVVKLLTDDPDVIIYWISDTRGDFE